MFHETFYQKDDSGKRFVDVLKEKGIIPGIKVGDRSCSSKVLLSKNKFL